MTTPSKEIRDPKFHVTCVIEKKDAPTETLVFAGEPPKEIMDQFQTFLGDGKANVTVATDMGLKKFGNGVSAMVSITLTCGQDSASIDQAVRLASSAARHYVRKYHEEAENELRSWLQANGRAVEF